MKHLQRRFLGLCLLPILLTCLDCVLTLAGQSKEYWSGDFARANEATLWCHELLAYHPLAFVAGQVAITAVAMGLILLTPRIVAVIFSISQSLAHWAGASSWLLSDRFRYGHVTFWGLAMLTLVGVIAGGWYAWRAGLRSNTLDSSIGFAFRWGTIAVLFVILLVFVVCVFVVFVQSSQARFLWVGTVWPFVLFVYCCNEYWRELKQRKQKLNA